LTNFTRPITHILQFVTFNISQLTHKIEPYNWLHCSNQNCFRLPF
jgi:hypothetical protein